MVLFGQVVVGPPGSGKTTYCHGMNMFVAELGRKCHIVNLDFANDILPYTPSVDVRDLVSLQDAMEEHKLGPNGGLMYCMEVLLENISWLEEKLQELDTNYIIFDCPGQVELYTHHTAFKTILEKITKALNCRLCSVHLVDSFYCCQPSTFISAVLLVTSTMLRLGLPHVNVLTKVDLLKFHGPLPFNLDFFTECTNLAPLIRYIDGNVPTMEGKDIHADANSSSDQEEEQEGEVVHDQIDTTSSSGNTSGSGGGAGRTKLQQRFVKLSAALCEVVDDFGLVSFHPLNIEDAETVGRVLAATDNANGFNLAVHEASEWLKQQEDNAMKSSNKVADGSSNTNSNTSSSATGSMPSNYDLFRLAARNTESNYSYSLDIQEKYGLL